MPPAMPGSTGRAPTATPGAPTTTRIPGSVRSQSRKWVPSAEILPRAARAGGVPAVCNKAVTASQQTLRAQLAVHRRIKGVTPAPAPHASAARTILVVDDEAALVEAVRARLVSEGYAVRVAADGPSALGAGAAERPDLGVL